MKRRDLFKLIGLGAAAALVPAGAQAARAEEKHPLQQGLWIFMDWDEGHRGRG